MKPGIVFWIVVVFALLWNGFGVYDLVMTMSGDEAYLAAYDPEQVAYWQEMPMWRDILWVTGVGSAFIASVLLAMRRDAAAPLFAVAPFCLLAGLLHDAVAGGLRFYGPVAFAFTGVIVAVAVFLSWYAYRQKRRGILKSFGGPAVPA